MHLTRSGRCCVPLSESHSSSFLLLLGDPWRDPDVFRPQGSGIRMNAACTSGSPSSSSAARRAIILGQAPPPHHYLSTFCDVFNCVCASSTVFQLLPTVFSGLRLLRQSATACCVLRLCAQLPLSVSATFRSPSASDFQRLLSLQ